MALRKMIMRTAAVAGVAASGAGIPEAAFADLAKCRDCCDWNFEACMACSDDLYFEYDTPAELKTRANFCGKRWEDCNYYTCDQEYPARQSSGCGYNGWDPAISCGKYLGY